MRPRLRRLDFRARLIGSEMRDFVGRPRAFADRWKRVGQKISVYSKKIVVFFFQCFSPSVPLSPSPSSFYLHYKYISVILTVF